MSVRSGLTIHRGTPNLSDTPRPMVVIGYSRRWLFRPEVQIRVPRETLERMPELLASYVEPKPVAHHGAHAFDFASLLACAWGRANCTARFRFISFFNRSSSPEGHLGFLSTSAIRAIASGAYSYNTELLMEVVCGPTPMLRFPPIPAIPAERHRRAMDRRASADA